MVILARSGSQRLVQKNFLQLKGLPLFEWTLRQALLHPNCGEVLFSSDSTEYLDHAKDVANELRLSDSLRLVKRDPRLASGSVSAREVIAQFVETGLLVDDLVGLLFPTAPFRRRTTLQRMIERVESESTGAFSCADYRPSPALGLEIDPSCGRGWKPTARPSPLFGRSVRSQDQKRVLHPSGTLQIGRCSTPEEVLRVWFSGSRAVPTSWPETVDIDVRDDLHYARYLAENVGLRPEDPFIAEDLHGV